MASPGYVSTLHRKPLQFKLTHYRWLHRIDRPTLLLWGAEDRIVTPAYGEDWRQAVSDRAGSSSSRCNSVVLPEPSVFCMHPAKAAWKLMVTGQGRVASRPFSESVHRS
jgi:pimeloyl-ACP methyl ester carboxylesterase